MKKSRLLNADISAVVARMGHTDELTICDAGLPIPDSVRRIDLAVEQDLPRMLSVLDAVLSELQIESVTIAEECKDSSPEFHQKLISIIQRHSHSTSIFYVSHEVFKQHTKNSKAAVRTGECTPFANVILKSGVVF